MPDRYPLVGLQLDLATAEGEDSAFLMYDLWHLQIVSEILHIDRSQTHSGLIALSNYGLPL